ncbi:MAG: molybdopterin molybdotransferase MoeA [Bacteroidota bacterium]
MITVEEATQIVLASTKDFGTTMVALHDAIGQILREDLTADRDFPPYNRVKMDGVAIAYEAFEQGKRSFPIQEVAAAGSPQKKLSVLTNCLEVMTGAILPEGTDTVIRYEDIETEGDSAYIKVDEIQANQNVHRQGSDRAKETVIVKAGKRISPAEIGIAATVGKTQLKVSRLPKTIIISTGDELVEIRETPLPYQIRKSNVHLLKTTLTQFGIQADTAHLQDDWEEILEKLGQILQDYDAILLSGGVSKGKFDFLPKVLEELGVNKHFHKIQQRPGKPMWFGTAPSGATIFALPGNPVSSFMCMQRYFIPWLRKSLGTSDTATPYAVLNEEVTFKPNLTYFLQVKIAYSKDGRLLANPVCGNGSGDLANLTEADGFLELEQGKDVYQQGETHRFWGFR